MNIEEAVMEERKQCASLCRELAKLFTDRAAVKALLAAQLAIMARGK